MNRRNFIKWLGALSLSPAVISVPSIVSEGASETSCPKTNEIKQIAIELHAKGLISNQTLFEVCEIDYTREVEIMRREPALL